ncbi:MAG: restriction endonuclease, partial [Acidimicrobiia bacterium]
SVLGGAEITILAECKHLRRPVERAEVLELKAKLDDVHAHKGVMFSTSGFQSGAIKYADTHGIATVTVVAGEWLFETKSLGPTPKPPPWAQFDRFAGIRLSGSNEGIGSHTIQRGRPDALLEWLRL